MAVYQKEINQRFLWNYLFLLQSFEWAFEIIFFTGSPYLEHFTNIDFVEFHKNINGQKTILIFKGFACIRYSKQHIFIADITFRKSCYKS